MSFLFINTIAVGRCCYCESVAIDCKIWRSEQHSIKTVWSRRRAFGVNVFRSFSGLEQLRIASSDHLGAREAVHASRFLLPMNAQQFLFEGRTIACWTGNILSTKILFWAIFKLFTTAPHLFLAILFNRALLRTVNFSPIQQIENYRRSSSGQNFILPICSSLRVIMMYPLW